MLQEGHLQQELNVSDTLLQQTSTIPGVRRQDSDGKSRSGSSTSMPSKIVTTEEQQSSKSEVLSEKVPWESQ